MTFSLIQRDLILIKETQKMKTDGENIQLNYVLDHIGLYPSVP